MKSRIRSLGMFGLLRGVAVPLALVAASLTVSSAAGAQTLHPHGAISLTTSTPCDSQWRLLAVPASFTNPGTLLANCLYQPEQVAVDSAGNAYVLDQYGDLSHYPNSIVWKVTPEGVRTEFASVPNGLAIAVDSSGNVFVSSSFIGSSIEEYSSTGSLLQTVSPVELGNISAMTFDAAGNLYFTVDHGGVFEFPPGFSPSTIPTRLASISFNAFGIAVSPQGTVYVSDGTDGNIQMYTSAGVSIGSEGSFSIPEQIALDRNGTLYVADEHNSGAAQGVLYALSPSGVQSAYNSGYSSPEGVAVSTSGSIYVTDEVLPGVSNTNNLIGGLYVMNSVSRPTPYVVATAVLVTNSFNLTGTISASWLGVPGAISYTCTLMYGFGNPSQFSVTSPSTNCSFPGLSPITPYGIEVVANGMGGSSLPAFAFASAPSTTTTVKHTIVCVRGTKVKRVTAYNPRCPAGWHQRP